ncbi:hypothetical protein [Microvirga antarctica]|uniref:hypothetical protein n=1 Tax=Microvirga antarctica TaxID=2819233 RepID=UPI001B3127BF|nr:hypothetical protein [Microvirga antarctica]
MAGRGAKAGSLIAALALASLLPYAFAQAQDFGDPDERQRQLEPPQGLSENLGGVVRPGSNESLQRIDTLADIFRALGACWQAPAGSGFSGQEITLRLAFKRNGEVLGRPQITYYRPGAGDQDQREAFTRSVTEAFKRCTPLPFTEKLGGAVAGRLMIFRFSDTRPM